MFSFFNKKPKLNNYAMEDLSVMLWNKADNPTHEIDFFDKNKLDYSLESLKHLDEYLEAIHQNTPQEDEIIKIALRAGAYVGEVIRKQAKEEYNWLEFNEAVKVNKMIEQFGMQLATASVLWSEPDNVIFPIAKVLKFIENGSEDSVYFFAEIACQSVPK